MEKSLHDALHRLASFNKNNAGLLFLTMQILDRCLILLEIILSGILLWLSMLGKDIKKHKKDNHNEWKRLIFKINEIFNGRKKCKRIMRKE